MRVTVDVKGDGEREIDLDSLDVGDGQPTYADLLAETAFSPHEVSVLVDGRPVPEDQPVETDHVTVLRLIRGG